MTDIIFNFAFTFFLLNNIYFILDQNLLQYNYISDYFPLFTFICYLNNKVFLSDENRFYGTISRSD